jgi:hypothetical protein
MTTELPQEGAGEDRPPTPEEFAAAMVHRLGRIPVRDVVFQTMATLADMSGIRLGLGPEGDAVRDLQQARQAIEALRALLQVADTEFGAAQARPFREPLAQLQLMYARLTEAGAGGPEDGGAPEGGAAPGGGPAASPPPREPPRDPGAASRLWVPPHYRGKG